MLNSSSKRPARQLALPFPAPANTWGGKRAGAGRKPAPGRGRVGHGARARHVAAHPVHVVLRSKFRPLRSQFVFPTVRRALADATRARAGFRVIQFSVQADHLHLVVEAENSRALSQGMQGLAIRIARRVNRLVFRRGQFWADRYFSRDLRSPRVVRNALAYVLNNFRKHGVSGGAHIDPYSSAPYFDGFRALARHTRSARTPSPELPLSARGPSPPRERWRVPVSTARTWLGRVGWRRAGLIAFADHGQVDH